MWVSILGYKNQNWVSSLNVEVCWKVHIFRFPTHFEWVSYPSYILIYPGLKFWNILKNWKMQGKVAIFSIRWHFDWWYVDEKLIYWLNSKCVGKPRVWTFQRTSNQIIVLGLQVFMAMWILTNDTILYLGVQRKWTVFWGC